ncbi:MAG: hypothetical protein ACI8RT_001181 [Candidatus Azotimanducaceae bacterium]|jgi:hypothetical protein
MALNSPWECENVRRQQLLENKKEKQERKNR